MYIEIIFIENFIINYLLAYETEKILKKSSELHNRLLGITLISMYTVIIELINIDIILYLTCNVLIIFFTAFIILQPKTVNEYIKYIATYIYQSILLVGIIYILVLLNIKNDIYIYIFGFIILKIVNAIFNKMILIIVKNIFNSYQFEFVIGKYQYKYYAILDTGNDLKYKNENVIILIDKKNLINELEKNNIKSSKIFVQSINGEDEKKIYILTSAEFISKKEKIQLENIPILVVEKKSKFLNAYDSIIGLSTYLKYIGG